MRYNYNDIFLKGGDLVKLLANDYKPEDICRIMREWTELDREDFGKSVHRTKRSIQSLETGQRHFTVQTLLDIAKAHNMNVIIEKKEVEAKK